MYPAVVRVSGTGRLEEFRERVRWLMVRDPDAEAYVEAHRDGVLEYRFEIRRGIPFPAFAHASADFPELRVDAEWEDAGSGVRGSAVIESGRLVEQKSEPLAPVRSGMMVSVGETGALRFALACAPLEDAWIGYCVDAGRHAYFRLRADTLDWAEGAPSRWTHRIEHGVSASADAPIGEVLLAELEAIAFAFAQEWLWFDEAPAAETAHERRRYEERGWTVRGANLVVARALEVGLGGTLDRLAPEALPVLEAVRTVWRAERGAAA